MKIKLILFFLSLLIHLQSLAQDTIATQPNFYRSVNNKQYWKNKLPYLGYWQQDVQYKIEAEIDDSLSIINCKKYELTYWNNSPFALTEVYFHLNENAFQPGSHYHDLNLNNDIKVTFGKNEAIGLGTTIENLEINQLPVKTELDNTILKVQLNEPLHSGDSIIITCSFKTYWDNGSLRRRNKSFESFGYKHFDGVHWYPIIAVYDMKAGWNTDQHLDKEFYANFGTFDVSLTFPQEYIVEATGEIQNESEVLPKELKEKLNLKNFASKPFNEAPSVIIPRVPGKKKTWIYHAENVHNFAFTADPLYRIGELEWNGIKIITLAQEPHASKWQLSGWFTKEVIKTYSRDFGNYDWPKIIVADAKDGMEYPMLTLDNGTYPQHQSLLAHEVGHMWFYGMVGSNETYRAFLDEGFTQFLTVWSMDNIVGKTRDKEGGNKYINKFIDSSNTRYENLYFPYINHVVEAYDEPLNTHSSGFNGALRHGGNYGLVYYKTGVMLYNLKYVLGDSLFIKALQHYVSKWKFAHPYPEDFRQAIIEFTQTDLNWFFDQWLETTKYIDYSIQNVKKNKNKDSNTIDYSITFERKGRMQMPLDFTITTKDDSTYQYHIPNTWFIKDSILKKTLPKWYGWDLLHPTYTTNIQLPKEIKKIEIDPLHYLADIDLTNNKWRNNGISTTQFDHRIPNLIRWDKQRNYIRPDFWYNSVDGIQAGIHLEGNYFGKYSYAATIWGNSSIGNTDSIAFTKTYLPLAFALSGKSLVNKFWKQSSINYSTSHYGGITAGKIEFEKIFRKQDQRNKRYTKLLFNIKSLYNHTNYDHYLLEPTLWGNGNLNSNLRNNTFNIGYFKNYFYTSGTGDVTFALRAPFILSDYNYSHLSIVLNNTINISKFEIKSRVFSQLGFSQTYPLESALMLSGANNEDLQENKYTRANGFISKDWQGIGATTNHFHYGGGLNLRGYSGYYAVEEITRNGTDSLFLGYLSNSGASWNVEIDFDRFIKLNPKGITKNLKIDTYLFNDIGFLGFQNPKKERIMGKIRMNSGIGTTLAIKFSPYQINPLVLRVDFPLFLNSPPFGEDFFQFRYLIGINRSF